jgi:glycosyltransferase involved in cell wall biosynthesis
MENSSPKIVFCGMIGSPFILQDLELLQQYYEVIPINLNKIQKSKINFVIHIWSDIYKVYKSLRNSDLIYIWFVDVHTFPFLILSRLLHKKSIVLVGGWEVAKYPEINYGNQFNFWRGAVTCWCLRNSDVVIVPSNAYKEITLNAEPRSNICVVPMAIDKSLCDYPLPNKSDTIITALFMLKFTTNILKGIPTFKAASERVPYNCVIYEGIKHSILLDRLREAKVYCQLSYTESFGVTNLEAMACGCVPIVTDRDALPEIVDGVGIIIPYGDIDATEQAMRDAMKMDGNLARERSKLFVKEERIKLLSKVINSDYNDEPLVSVVIPSYNSAHWLSDTINSILKQSYTNIEIIVIDDCSTDNTYEVVSKFSNIKYIKNYTNMGECISSRKGFDIANGTYICRLSSDDMYINPDKIKNQVVIMMKTGADFSYNSINRSGESLENSVDINTYWMLVPVKYGNKMLQVFDNFILKFPHLAFARILLSNPINSSTLMFRKSSYMNSAKWTTGKTRTDCDGLLLYNLFLQKYKCIAIREMGSFYRLHPNQATNISLTYKDDMRKHKLEVINQVLYAGNYPWWLKFVVKIIKRR